MKRKLSKEGRKFIEEAEGLRLEAYQDGAGIWTIGYGHTGPEVKEGLLWSKEKADAEFIKDSNWAVEAVDEAVSGVPCTQNQFDAMVSLCFNIGAEAFRGSSVKRNHVDGLYQLAANSFLLWNKIRNPKTGKLERSQGLANRRGKERELYLRVPE